MAESDRDKLIREDRQRRRARVYNHPSSEARRQEEKRGPAKPGIGARQIDERAGMATRHRKESRELNDRQREERNHYHPTAGHGNPPADLDGRHKAQRDKLDAKHERERTAMQDRHREERVTAARKGKLG